MTLVIIQLHLFTVFYMFSSFINHAPLYRAFGFATQPPLIGFVLFQVSVLCSFYDLITSNGMSMIACHLTDGIHPILPIKCRLAA